ncbi:hypothetical protein DICPUDRAFT_77782 [Dictyostelium purpureum]|uniref:C2H2-type domain-containing protein n=1 Tax=Dictyostelium purpureum TaxID=5786 RepID=F0ZHL4_DICPU|nr:uncharacterized protein DICPUDRAFT_77782 [Dictyostelium purpureum]EGC36534.1 hypothetical protein DICPUDRAFT_77782 [Dictyostelium purpureum]|eukprot:XP_003286906.1 hypothetical protein DICPUDRAFT_77782 [Dictyostelium purpureum]
MYSKLYENLENDKLNILEDYGYVRGVEYEEEEEFYSLDDENTSGQTKFNFETGMKDVDKLQPISQIYYLRRVLTIRQSSCYRSEPRASDTFFNICTHAGCQQVFVQQKTFIKHIGLDHTLIVPTEEQKVELVKAQGFEFANDFHKLNVKSKVKGSPAILFLDTETTGLSVATDEIIEISIIDLYDGSHFYKLINPTTTVSSNEYRCDMEPSLIEYLSKYQESGAYIIAHNEKFDRGILLKAGDDTQDGDTDKGTSALESVINGFSAISLKKIFGEDIKKNLEKNVEGKMKKAEYVKVISDYLKDNRSQVTTVVNKLKEDNRIVKKNRNEKKLENKTKE